MYVSSITINNFKSLGTDGNEIIFDKRITPIIGKNESGKSNILCGLSHININENMNKLFDDINLVNRSDLKNQISYSIILKPTLEEQNTHKIIEETYISINKNQCLITGSLQIKFQEEVQYELNDIISKFNQNDFKYNQEQLKELNIMKIEIKNFELSEINNKIKYFLRRSVNTPQFKEKHTKLKELNNKIKTITSFIPKFVFINKEKKLNSEYTIKQLNEELDSNNITEKSLIINFLQIINQDKIDILNILRSNNGQIINSQTKEINGKIQEYFNNEFNNFYKTEKLKLELSFVNKMLNFFVSDEKNKCTSLSERSAGLQWYINTFIYLKSMNLSTENLVFLLDEPGTSIHINEQQNLIKFFNKITDNNQILYTTHSPYMITNEIINIGAIRLIDKREDGITRIYNSIPSYNSKIKGKDTIAPILQCIGMNLNNSIGPSFTKVNLITEGISDYYYIKAMAQKLNFDINSYNIIPSTGASNIRNLCSILMGWGCKFIAIFDFDKAGVETGGEILEKKLNLKNNESFIYLKNIESENINKSAYKDNPIEIENLITTKELDNFKKVFPDSVNLGKILLSKFFFDNIDKYECQKACITNFKEFFSRIKSIQ